MTSMNRSLRHAGLAVLALFLVAGPAQAISDLSADLCGDPTAAAENVADHYDEEANRIDTSGFENPEKDCLKLCKSMVKLCAKTAKSDAACIKEGDKFTHKLAKALCDDNECKAAVKTNESGDKDELKAALDQAGENCNVLGDTCFGACMDGAVFPAEGLPL